jgi:hypothetical protein
MAFRIDFRGGQPRRPVHAEMLLNDLNRSKTHLNRSETHLKPADIR